MTSSLARVANVYRFGTCQKVRRVLISRETKDMPLLLVTGYPACGKSTIVLRICQYFAEKGRETLIVQDEDNSLFSRDDYGKSDKEKEHRSFIRSCVQKSLNQNTIVICDGLNYIKGYRYELFLIAKLCKTTFAVLYCHGDESTCKWLNGQSEERARYKEETLADIIGRYEKPDSRNRWDSPLYEIIVGRSERIASEEVQEDMSIDLEHPSPKNVEIPLEDIFNWLSEGKALTQNQSTVVVPVSPITFLHELDRVTQEIVGEIIQGQKTAAIGQQIPVSSALDQEKVVVKKHRTLAELTRLRRQFINASKNSRIDSREKIVSLFVNYLNNN